MPDNFSASLSENILTLLVFNESKVLALVNNIEVGHFENIYYKTIADKAIDFYKAFNEPPKEHIADLLEKELNSEANGDIYGKILNNLYNNRDSLNVDYILNELERFIRTQNLKKSTKKVMELLQYGKVDEAEDVINTSRKSLINTFNPGIIFSPSNEEIFNATESLEEDFIYTGIKTLDMLEHVPTKKELFTLVAPSGKGKAQALDSVIYTPYGEKLMGNICIGDLVSTPDGGTSRVAQIHPQGKKPMFKLTFYDGSTTKSTSDHLWECWVAKGRNRKIRTTEEIKILLDKGSHVLMPLSKPVFFQEKEILIHPYLLGVLLGDGGLTKKTDDRYIPKEYLYNSIENRIELLRGLLDTDGYIDIQGHIHYTSKSKKLIDNVIFLVQSLGGTARVVQKSIAINDKDGFTKYHRVYYTVYIKIKDSYKYFSLKRKKKRSLPFNGGYSELARRLISIEYIGEEDAQCITIENNDGLYLTDNFIVTHNSWFLVHLAKYALLQRKKVLHITLELSERRLIQRYLQNFFGIASKNVDIQYYNAIFETEKSGDLYKINLSKLKDIKTLRDDGIIPYLKERMNKVLRPSTGLIIKEFPTGSLSVNGLVRYLDNLEAYHNFIPDIILLDYLDLMSIDSDKMRIDLGRTGVELRGLAVERNLAMVTVAQTNRDAEGKAVITRKNLGEDFSKVKTSDVLVIYNQTYEEKERNLARLFFDKGRNSRDGETVLISQNYSIGQFCLDSIKISSSYWDVLNGKN